MQIQFEPRLLPVNQGCCLLTFGYWYICFFFAFLSPLTALEQLAGGSSYSPAQSLAPCSSAPVWNEQNCCFSKLQSIWMSSCQSRPVRGCAWGFREVSCSITFMAPSDLWAICDLRHWQSSAPKAGPVIFFISFFLFLLPSLPHALVMLPLSFFSVFKVVESRFKEFGGES